MILRVFSGVVGLLVFVGVLRANAQSERAILTGAVYCGDQRFPKAAVQITAISATTSPSTFALHADEEGGFRLALSAGQYSVNAMAEGCISQATSIIISPVKNDSLVFHLEKLPYFNEPNPFRGEDEGTLSGIVKDEWQVPLSGPTIITVQRKPDQGEKRIYPSFHVYPDAAGRFGIPLIPGSYSVRVGVECGFTEQNITVLVESAKVLSKDFVLKANNLRCDRIAAEPAVEPVPAPIPDHIDHKHP